MRQSKNKKQAKKYPVALKKTYLAMIKNAVGTEMFRSFYLIKGGKTEDDTQNGRLCCAFFVTAILYHFGLIKTPHLTVTSTQKDLEKSGWRLIPKPRTGAVLFWEKKCKNGSCNRHVGFYLGTNQAVSNMSSKGKVGQHHWTYKNKRKVEAVYWYGKLEQNGKKIDN